MIRIRQIDWDADGTFAVLTRPGAAAEVIRMSPADEERILVGLLEAMLARRGKVIVRPAVRPRLDDLDVLPSHFIGSFDE